MANIIYFSVKKPLPAQNKRFLTLLALETCTEHIEEGNDIQLISENNERFELKFVTHNDKIIGFDVTTSGTSEQKINTIVECIKTTIKIFV